MRLMLVTDAWAPQVNGVAHSLERTVALLRAGGDRVDVMAPELFRTLPCPTYPEIRLAIVAPAEIARRIGDLDPDYVHIATEGPLGMMARRHCLRSGRGFTTSYHTKFPEYLSARMPVPLSWGYGFMRRFHNAGRGCMVASATLKADLAARGFGTRMLWPRGVDAELFRPRPGADPGVPRPAFLYVGRVAVEKNIEAFLSLDLPGSKIVVGDGPAREDLQRRFPDAHFRGTLRGEALAEAYAAADVFVFPSRTDTFGNVLLEALASGLPVAAYPVTGPSDIIRDPRIGVLSEDLGEAALAAVALSGSAAREYALRYSWEASAATLRENIITANAAGVRAAA